MPDMTIQNTDITLSNIWKMVGPRTRLDEVKAEILANDPGGDSFLLVLFWPVSASYLGVRAWGREGEFSDKIDETIQDIKQSGIPEERIPGALRKGRSHTLAARVKRDETLGLEFKIDTDDKVFLEEAATTELGGLIREIEVLAVGGGSAPVIKVGVIHLHLEPAGPMKRYEGYVALDLGNTNSTMVCLHAHELGRVSDVDVVKLEQTADAGPIPSAVRLTRFDPAPDEDPDLMEKAECQVGNDALEGPISGLVLGAKRILADPDPNARHRFNLNGQSYAADKTLPAELFLSAMFRAFHRAKFHVPVQLAITHPTTFSPWEVAQLRQAVIQGWRRSLRAKTRTYDAKKLPVPEFPHVIIDEASAAAFYFIYRDFIRAPGGLDLLHYLYPEGLNLLVFDCGGGTTDIALVHVRVERGKQQKVEKPYKLAIQVLGRTGHRSFGGDDITIAAFRVLKARLAAKLSTNTRLEYPPMPDQAASLPAWLDANRRVINETVPTEFSPDNLSLGDNRRRMETAALLWRWAEQFKIELGRGESPAKAKNPQAMSALLTNLQDHNRGTDRPLDDSRLRGALQGIEIHRAEVDALIRKPLEASIEYANRMITAKLHRPDSPGGEVHRVYLVGNASRYPMVREQIEARLAVPFIARRMGEVLGEDLKNSVAKGAALALRLSIRAENMDIDFDKRLNRRLPFNVTVRDNTAGGSRTIYHEQQVYDELPERTLPVPLFDGPDEGRIRKEMSLERFWPGDNSPSVFLWFPFDEVIRGPLSVRYDLTRERFVMRDDGGSGTDVPGQEIYRATYVAPVQSGKL